MPSVNLSMMLKEDNSNWFEFYEHYMSTYTHNQANIALDAESKSPDGTIYTDEEAIAAAYGPEPVRPEPPEPRSLRSDPAAGQANDLRLYDLSVQLYLQDKREYTARVNTIDKLCQQATETLSQLVHPTTVKTLLTKVRGPRERMTVLLKNCKPDILKLTATYEADYETLKTQFTWAGVEAWLLKWSANILDLNRVDSYMVHRGYYLNQLTALLQSSYAPGSKSAGMLLKLRHSDMNQHKNKSVYQNCNEVKDMIIKSKLSDGPTKPQPFKKVYAAEATLNLGEQDEASEAAGNAPTQSKNNKRQAPSGQGGPYNKRRDERLVCGACGRRHVMKECMVLWREGYRPYPGQVTKEEAEARLKKNTKEWAEYQDLKKNKGH